jgi:hypothetical protein
VTAALQLKEVPTTLQLEIPTTSVMSRCSGPTVRVESTIKAARIHYLEVHTALAVLQL